MKTYLHYLSFIRHYRVHFIAWFLFIFYEVVISGLLGGHFYTFGNYAVFYVFNIILFYFHAHVAMPAARLRTKHAIWLLPLIIATEIIIYVPVTIYIAAFLVKYANLVLSTPAILNHRTILNMIWRGMYIIFFSTGYYFLISYLKERKILQEREKEKLLMIIENQNVQAELIKSQHAHLKAQINPHFLFNTLSFIYSNTRKTAPAAAEAIMALSEMMRYAIQDDNDANKTNLVMEIEQVKNLIGLHQIKADQKLNIVFECDADVTDIQIIPLVLITLTENIFKHGDLKEKNFPARVTVSINDNLLCIETRNLIGHNTISKSHNIGLINIKKRLYMVYGDNAQLHEFIDQDNCFNVTLNIRL